MLLRKQILLEHWTVDYLAIISVMCGQSVGKLVRIYNALAVIEFAKLTGYRAAIDTAEFYQLFHATYDNAPADLLQRRKIFRPLFDLVLHEGRKAAEYRIERLPKLNEIKSRRDSNPA